MLAFVHIWKTAGTTFTQLLRRHFGLRHFDRPGFRHRPLTASHLKRIRYLYPGLTSIGGHPVRPYANLHEAAPDIRYHSFLRDPFDRAVSHFIWMLRWKAHEGETYSHYTETLKDWNAAPENRNLQCRFFHPDGTFESAKTVIRRYPHLLMRVDHFDASLLLFRHWAGLPDMDLHYVPRNTARDPNERLLSSHPDELQHISQYRQELLSNSALQSLLHESNGEDQRLYDWLLEDIWPKQVEQYPGDLTGDTSQFRNENERTDLNPAEPWTARLYRNVVFKPMKPLLLPTGEPAQVEASPWL